MIVINNDSSLFLKEENLSRQCVAKILLERKNIAKDYQSF